MATSLVDDTRLASSIEPRAVSDRGRQLGRAEGLWTLFGASLLVAFLSFVVLSGA